MAAGGRAVRAATVLLLAAISLVCADFDWARLANQDILQHGDVRAIALQKFTVRQRA